MARMVKPSIPLVHGIINIWVLAHMEVVGSEVSHHLLVHPVVLGLLRHVIHVGGRVHWKMVLVSNVYMGPLEVPLLELLWLWRGCLGSIIHVIGSHCRRRHSSQLKVVLSEVIFLILS